MFEEVRTKKNETARRGALAVSSSDKKRTRYVVAHPEQRGLYVRIPPSGPNVFAAVARDPYGKQVWHTVGSADALEIEEARDKARAAIKRIKQGLPAIEAPPVKPDAFKSVAENWLERHVAAKGLRSQVEIERVLKKYVYPTWGDREFTGIKRSDVAKLLDIIEDNNGARQADIVLAIVRGIANWYAARNDSYQTPFVRGMRRNKGVARERILDDSELKAVWKAASDGTFGAFIKVLLLTAQRRGAVMRMRWDEISDGEGVWQIPAEARAKGNAGTLKLPARALEIINAQPKLDGNPFVFAAARGDGPANGFSKSKVEFDKRCAGVAKWTLHDLRRTARSLMSRADVRPDIAERVMGHAIKGVERIYDRHRYDVEKADAVARLAALIETIINPPADNVRPLRRRKASA